MLRLRQARREGAGFSFIEVIITVSLMGILLAFIVPSYGAIQRHGKQVDVDTAAEAAHALVTDYFAARDRTVVAGEPETPATALRELKHEGLEFDFLNSKGEVLAEPAKVFCVRARNTQDLHDGKVVYSAKRGACDRAEAPTPPTPTPGPSTSPPPAPATATILQLNCPTQLSSYRLPLSGFRGEARWSDGLVQNATASTPLPARSLEANRAYAVNLTGTFTGVTSAALAQSEKDCLRSVDSWGTPASNTTGSMEQAFLGNRNLTAVATPNFTLTNLNYTFGGATAFNQSVAAWNTRQVTTMMGTFAQATSFNQPLTSWRTEKVTSIAHMFNGASAFNQPIGTWDISQVTDMSGTFSSASAFNQNINGWSTNKVALLNSTFERATSFNQPLDRWNTTSVTEMNYTFYLASTFDQNLSSWQVRGVLKAVSFALGTRIGLQLHKWPSFTLL